MSYGMAATSVTLRIPDEVLERVDEARGEETRTTFIVAALVARFGGEPRKAEQLVGPSEPEQRPMGTPRARLAPPPVGPAVSKPRKKTGLVTEPSERSRDDVTPFFKKG